MRPCRPLLALFGLLLVSGKLQGGEPAPWPAAGRAAWWQAHPDSTSRAEEARRLRGELKAFYQALPESATALPPGFIDRYYQLRWIELLQNRKTLALLQDNTLLPEAEALAADDTAGRLFLDHLKPEDDAPEAVLLLARLRKAQPELLAAYPALAVAYALVFDQPFPPSWPHRQVDPSQLPNGDADPVERFAYYARLDQAKELDLSPAELDVDELRFLVDSQTSFAELDWARKNIRESKGRFDRVFSSISYDSRRIELQKYDWPWKTYQLADIQKAGGICVDQAYYAFIGGKARGLPTLFFSGQGSGGGHAWFGYLERKGKWRLDCGRYESQNYPVGEAVDPQTWTAINDAELDFLGGGLAGTPEYRLARYHVEWALLDPESLPRSAQKARAADPHLPEAWRLEAAWMQKERLPLDRQKSFYEAWIRQFDKMRDYKVEGQTRYLEVLKAAGDPAAAGLQQAIVRENRRKRFDLGIGMGVETVFEKLDGKDWPGAETEFKSLVRKFDDQGGGNLFYMLVEPYVVTCLEEGQNELAAKALKYTERKLDVEPGSILAMEIEKLRGYVKSGLPARK
jgi:hypothetical protein